MNTPNGRSRCFAALERRGLHFGKYDLKQGAFDPSELPGAPINFNQASPSAYMRGNARAVPFALALMRSLELAGARVLNGTRAFSLELSKSAAPVPGLDGRRDSFGTGLCGADKELAAFPEKSPT